LHMKRIKYQFFFLLFTFQIQGLSQVLTLEGTVLDNSTRMPLVEANVYLKNSTCGTVTDSSGRFKLTCPLSLNKEILIVNYLGYEQFELLLKDYKNNSTIFLQPKSLPLVDEVIVHGERIDLIKEDIPHATKVLEFDEIVQKGSSEISDIFKSVPTIQMEGNDLDGRTIQIRGSDPEEVKVYYDGILLNNLQFNNSADLSIIPVENIERIEVAKGGNLSFLGAGAFGGVVNIISRNEMQRSFLVKGRYGSFNTRSFNTQVNIPLSRKLVFNYFGQLTRFSPDIEYFPSEKFSTKTTNEEIRTSKQTHAVGLNYFTRTGQWSGKFLGYFLDYKKPFWQSNYSNYLYGITYNGDILGIRYINLCINHYSSDNQITREQTSKLSYVSNYQTGQINARLAKKFNIGLNSLQLSTEYFHEELVNNSDAIDKTYTKKLYHASVYDNRINLAAVLSLNDNSGLVSDFNWKVFVGSRSEFLATGDNDLLNMFGLLVDYKYEKWKFSPYFNYGQNIKYASLQENAYIKDLTDPVHWDSLNTRLKPEYSTSGELGLKVDYVSTSGFYSYLEFDFSLFSRTIYNKLLRRPFDDLIAQVPVERSVIKGFEGSVMVKEIFRDLSLNAGYIKMNLDNAWAFLYNPEKKYTLQLNYVAPFGLYAMSTFFYEGKSQAWYYNVDNQLETEELPAFNDVDISLGFRVKLMKTGFNLNLSAYNIFDRSGFQYYYLKKRNLQISLTIQI
jgi:outer membrane receptor protein involved in Fe transport